MIQVATIKSIGLGLSYQDLGRTGYTNCGISSAGSIDPNSHKIANKLLDNHPNSTTIEITLGGAEIIFTHTTWVSLTGPASSNLIPANTATQIKAGQILKIVPPRHGIWSYLAIPTGFHSEEAFNSHSRHERSNLGTKIRVNTQLYTTPKNPYPRIATRYPHPENLINYSTHPPFRVHPSPHPIPNHILEKFYSTSWKISSKIDRSGYRLTGNSLASIEPIPSLPVIPGCIQLPPNGQPIITLNDGPTTGGYPLLGIIDSEDLPAFTQHQPNTNVKFTPYQHNKQ